MSTTRVVSATCASVLAAGGLWLGAGRALAAPEPGTTECATLVEADTTVNAALDVLTNLPATAPLADRQAAQTRLDQARVDVTARLCTGPDDPTPTTTSPTPPTATTPSTPSGDDRDCTDFASRTDAQAFYDRVSTPNDRDPSRLDSDGDGVACEAPAGGIDPTEDDGSVVPDGSQVIDVPQGSASTGGGV